ncbi:hypothetical protein B0A49_00426 [Cryomyces minteri]|uniref:G protein-coupled receptor GPR1/2/3 C-terminal domain-containing protein n=1 Tax=Cryomyces minteri TaxID=331657 RepID=A0A4U0Y2F4_9PEZI|nr:hypothetical protein B0A49_00426 [Cryomyces minteri]
MPSVPAIRGADGYFEAPYSLDPLPPSLHTGLVLVGLPAVLSMLSTVSLLGFIAHRFITWRKHYGAGPWRNQNVLLICNLLLADLQQSMAFVIGFYWVHQGRIIAPTRACFAQGWLLNMGDVASGLFVFAIALYTFYSVVQDRRLAYSGFLCAIAAVYSSHSRSRRSAQSTTAISSSCEPELGFVCWISSQYDTERLTLHYVWIFTVELGTVVTYAILFVYLRRRTHRVPTGFRSTTQKRIDRATKLMVVYPIVYCALTLPLATGRMYSMTHANVVLPMYYYCLAGAFMTSGGWIDALMYAWTRRVLLEESEGKSRSYAGGSTAQSGLMMQGRT